MERSWKSQELNFPQKNFVNTVGAYVSPILVNTTEIFEYWTTSKFNCVKVNCDTTVFR